MRFWLTSFFVLFALVKLVEWLRALELPFSVVVIAGLLLAIASNYDKRQLFPFWSDLMAAKAMAADATPSVELDVASPLIPVEPTSVSPSVATPEPTQSNVAQGSVVQGCVTQGRVTHASVELPPFNN